MEKVEVVVVDSKILDKIFEEIRQINDKLDRKTEPLSGVWLDNRDVCQLLKISIRTLQNYRDSKIVPFSQFGAKIYYRASDIEKHLEKHYNGR